MNKIYTFAPLVCVFLILSLPALLACGPIIYFLMQENGAASFIAVLLAPSIFVVSYVVTAGLLAYPTCAAITEGRVPRRSNHRIYRQRRIYGICWTMVYYFTPLYHVCLSVPFLKAMLFRLFGYRGSLSFTCYPDTWIRDLTLLKLGENCYLSNRATIGTNIVQKSGHLLVDTISIGANSIVGHLAVLAPGVSVGHDSEIGVNCAIGIRARIGNHVTIKPTVTVYHGTVVGDYVTIEPNVYIGLGCVIGSGLKIPNGCYVPDKTHLLSQADVEQTRLQQGRALNSMRSASDLGSSQECLHQPLPGESALFCNPSP